MVGNPPKQKVDVTLMIILSFLPIVCLYAAWRIQKFWALVVLGIILELLIWASFFLLGFAVSWELSLVVSLVAYIGLTVLFVKYYAEKYNAKIEPVKIESKKIDTDFIPTDSWGDSLESKKI